jgi:hypothetical protein
MNAKLIVLVMMIGTAAGMYRGYECSVSFDEKCIVRQP